MPTTTEKWPLTVDEARLDELLEHIALEDSDRQFTDDPLQQAFDVIDELRARLAAAESDRDRYRATLEFYAEKRNYLASDISISRIDADDGHRARAALGGEPDAESH